MDKPKTSTTEAVRQFAAANSLVRKKQLVESLGISLNQAKHAVETLVTQGRLRRIGHGSYEFVEEVASAREAPVEEKIWRAMRINPRFSASDIAVQAGTTEAYVYRRMREYRANGFVKPSGQRFIPGGREKLWRLTLSGRDHSSAPRMQKFEPDPLVVAVVRLNHLVCTGIAVRVDDARAEAVRLCDEIRRKLADEDGDGEVLPAAGG